MTDSDNKSQFSEKNNFPWPAYAEIFEVREHLGNETNWAFLCKMCINKKIIHASKTSTANLRKHICVSLYIILIRLLRIIIFNVNFRLFLILMGLSIILNSLYV